MVGYIYKLTSPSGKSYIGQTTMDPEKRWGSGYNYSRQGLIGKAIDKYSWQNIKREIIETVETNNINELIVKLNDREIYWGQKYNTLCPGGYNLSLGGNKIMTDSTKEKLRVIALRYWSVPENRARSSKLNKRRYLNPKYIQISRANAAYMHTPESRAKARDSIMKYNKANPDKIAERNRKIGLANSGIKNGMYGKEPSNKGGIGFRHSAKTIEKMSISQRENANSASGIRARKLGAHRRWHRDKSNANCIFCSN